LRCQTGKDRPALGSDVPPPPLENETLATLVVTSTSGSGAVHTLHNVVSERDTAVPADTGIAMATMPTMMRTRETIAGITRGTEAGARVAHAAEAAAAIVKLRKMRLAGKESGGDESMQMR
jgi:hypothetical protein